MKNKVLLSLSFYALLGLLVALHSCQRENNLSTETVKIQADVKIQVGDVVYQNLDAQIKVTGYDAYDQAVWTKDFIYSGTPSPLEIKNGLHHYSITLVDKWGITTVLADIAANDLWNGRTDGPAPVTYILSGSVEAKKLSAVVTSREVDDQDSGIVYRPETKDVYSYNFNDQVEFIHHEAYNPVTSAYEGVSTDQFFYAGVTVLKIVTTLANEGDDSGYRYSYGLNKITQSRYIHNVPEWSLESTIQYDTANGNNKVRIDYNHSDGNSFLYEFDLVNHNITKDKTTKAAQLCSEGNYTYDKNINPFAQLGYKDFSVQNWSINNKVTDLVNYTACSFPTILPVSHEYTYDHEGYPVTKVTSYKGGDGSVSRYHSKQTFSYE